VVKVMVMNEAIAPSVDRFPEIVIKVWTKLQV
jgi:hypothetical protein